MSDPTCELCSHRRVCRPYTRMASLAADLLYTLKPATPAIQVFTATLAAHCDHYQEKDDK